MEHFSCILKKCNSSSQMTKNNTQLHMNIQKSRRDKSILYNEGTYGGITIPDLKLYYRATIRKQLDIGLKT